MDKNKNLPINTDNSSSTAENKSNQEETTLLLPSSSIDRETLQENIKTKLNNEIVEQEEEEEVTHRLYYENLSDEEIKNRLFSTATYDLLLPSRINQWLETDRTLYLFIRQYASLLATYSSLKMELELYQSYRKMTTWLLPWLSTMSETLLARNHANRQFFHIQKYINKHLENTEEKFGIITEKLAKAISDQQQQLLSSSTIDIKVITSAIILVVQEDQPRLNLNLIKKRYLLMLNVKDINLLHEFYYLKP